MANVKVALRVRPMSKRESAEGGRVIVEVDGKVAKIRNIKADSRLDSTWDSREKTVAFSFDYCYWSVDPEDPKYASQEMVFQDLGTSVLSGAFRGYNICVFAYGQTGSGKTYTMMGTPASIGLTPRICEGLFAKKDDYTDQTASCRVKVSFLEIYNERVRDLLKQSDQKKPYTLRVREHPETGPYVQGLTQRLVTDYKQVVELLEEGIAKRITAATHIHNASSRSHAIFTIHYAQAILENNLPSEIASKINLVDLAGSERADPSYCKDRITEGANINKSLVTLGIVISTLAQNSQMFSSCQSINTITSEGDSSHADSPSTSSVSGTRRPAYIPYRDSILTWLLKDSLGGNSKTIMIATISPASSSYNETMSTLRYASNAKNIINKPRVNEDANVKLIRELREEIDRLKSMLMSFELRNSSPSWSDDRDGNLTELVLQNEMKIEQLTKDWTSKWTDMKAIMEEYSVDINKKKAGVTIDSSLPHLMAMDDDILSTGVVLYHLREGTTKIGRSDSDHDQDIVLQGRWIERDHCMIDNKCGIVTLRPVQGAHCTVNGCEVTGSCRLSQGALVVLGKSHKFRFNHPAEAAILRQRRSINETPPILSCGALDWLNLDGSCTHSPHYILSSLDNLTWLLAHTPYSEEPQHFKLLICVASQQTHRRLVTGISHHMTVLPQISREIDAVHEEYKQKLRDQEAFHRKQIQQQQLYVEDLKQQILRGQIKAERELENDQALINQQIQENQQWLINENKRLAALQQQQREFAVQTETKLYAEAEVQSTIGLDICPSLLQQNKKRLVQLELLRRYSLKKAERNIRRKKVKFQLERIVKKQKLLEAKQNLEQLEASCWLSEECVKQSQVLNENTVQSSSDHRLQRRRKSLGLSSLQHREGAFCNSCLAQVPSCFLKRETVSALSTSPSADQSCEGNATGRLSSIEYLYRRSKDVSGSNDLNDEKGISFSVQRQLTEKQKPSSFANKRGAEKDSNDKAIMAYINKNYQKVEKLDDNPGQTGSQTQTSKGFSPDLFKEKNEPETFIAGTRMTKAKVLGDLSQAASSNLEQNRAQVSNIKTRMDIDGKGHRPSPENFPKEMKKTAYGNPPLVHLNQTAKNWKGAPNSALPSHEKSAVGQQEFLMVATSVGNLTKMNTQAPLFYAEKRWHSAEMLSAGASKTATEVLGNWQEDDENEISDTDSSYSVDSLSCAYAKAFSEKPIQDFDRNKCLANPEDSESDDSQMSQDSLVEKENKAKKENTSRFHKLKARHEPAKLCKSRTDHHVSSLVTSHTSRRRLRKPERSFSLDSLADGEEMPAEDPVEESKSDSSDEVPAEIFWKLQTPGSPAVQMEEGHESKTCDRDTEGTSYDLKLSSSFYLDTKPQPASSSACKQLLNGIKVSFVEQERSLDRRPYYASGNPLLTADAWSSCDSKVDISSPRAAPSSHEQLEFQEAHLCSLSKAELWLKKDDLKQSAAEVSFVSGSKQIHSITHLSRRINEINTFFSSDTSEVPLPETTTASKVSESESLNKILEGWTNCNENSSLVSQEVMSSFASSVGPSSSFVPVSAKHDYHGHSRSNYPEQEQLNELSTYRSATECTQTFSCLESASAADRLSLVSGKEEDSVPTAHPELSNDHSLKKTYFASVFPMQSSEQRDGFVSADLEDDFFRTSEKDYISDDYSNLMTKSSVTDSGRRASASAPAPESCTGLAHNMISTQASAVKQVQFGNHGQLFPRREVPTCSDEGFFLSDLNKNCSLVSSYKLEPLAGQGAESAVTAGVLRPGEGNLETMQETDYEQISAEEITETDFSSQKKTYRCNPLVVAHSASYDQSATPIEMAQEEIICMETSTDSLAEVAEDVPPFRANEECKPKDEDLSSMNHYEFKSKPVSKSYSHDCALADSQASCLSQQVSENPIFCIDSIREESSESKGHNVLNSQTVAQKAFSSEHENLVVNEVSYLIVNVNGKDESSPATVCESINDFLPESNSSMFYKASTKANLFQSASETENYDKLLERVTIAKGDYSATSNLTVEVNAAESCSEVHSGCLCATCSSKSTEQKISTHRMTDISIPLETETQNQSLLGSREEKEAFLESDCPEGILLVKDDVNFEPVRVFEYSTNTSATVSQGESLHVNEESKCLRNPETNPEETMVPYQNTKAGSDEERAQLISSALNLERNALQTKSRQIESLPDFQVQSITEDRSGEEFKDISLSQNPKKPLGTEACEVQREFYTNLRLTPEEVEKDELQVASTRIEHTQEPEALVHSGSHLETSSFCQKEKREKAEISIYSPECSLAPKLTPSALCSHTTDTTQNTSGVLDTCEGLFQRDKTTENVFNTEDVAATVLVSKPETEGQVNSSNLIEHYVPRSLPQEDKVNECEVTGSAEQIIMTNTEEPIVMRREGILTDENVLFPEGSPALHQMSCDRDDKEENFNQFKIPERYLTASGLEQDTRLEDDSRYRDSTEMSEHGGLVDSVADTRNAVMKGVDAYEYSVDGSTGIDQEFKSLHMKEDSDTYMSCSTQCPEHGALGNLNVSIARNRCDSCELNPVGSRVMEEKVHLMNLVQMDKEKQMLVENTEEVEVVILQNLNKLFPENKDGCQMTQDDSRLSEIFRESQSVSTSFSRNNEDISKEQNPSATLMCTEKKQEGSLKDFPCQSVNHLLYLGVSDDSHLAQDVPTALKGHTKASNSSVGTGAVLPYYETLMQSEVCVGMPVSVNHIGEDKYLPDKMPSKNTAFLQTRTTQDRQEEDTFVSGQTVNKNSSSTPYSAGGPECEVVILQPGGKGNPFSLEKILSSEGVTQDVNIGHEEHGIDLMVNKLSKGYLNSIEDTAQEEKATTVPDSLLLDNTNLLSSSEKKVMEGIEGGKTHSLQEVSMQKMVHHTNTAQKVLESGSLSQHDEKEKFLSTSYTTTNSQNENAKLPGVTGYQHDPRENQGFGTSEEFCIDQPGSSDSENTSTLSEGLNKSLWENPHYSKEFLSYNRNSGTSECSPGLLNHAASSADALIASSEDKGKNDAALSRETKYFESESTDLSASATFPDVSQKGDERKTNSAVAEATDRQNNKLPKNVAGTDRKEKIRQNSFENCSDIKENEIPEYSEHYNNPSHVPESGSLTFQGRGQSGSEESKSLPPCFAEDTPADPPFQSSKNFTAFDTSCLLEDSKSLIFGQLEGSLQDTFLTGEVSSSSANVCSVKDYPQAFASVNHPFLTPFSESSLTADIGPGETGTYDTSHTNILKHSPFAVLQIQDTQSDKAVVFDEPIRASGSILLSLAKENRHCPVSDTDSTSYEHSAVGGEPVYGSNHERFDSDIKVGQHHWDKVPPQEACTGHIEEVLTDNSGLLPSLPFGDMGRAILVKEGQMKSILNRNEAELHSKNEAECFAGKIEQRKTFCREPVEMQTNVSSNSANELIGSEVRVLENLYPGDVDVDAECTNSFSPTYPTYSRSTDPRRLYHAVLGFEKNPADLQDNGQYVPTGDQLEQVLDKTNTGGRKEILLCQNGTDSGIDGPVAGAGNCSPMGGDLMRNKTLKSERLKFSVMNNDSTSVKLLPETHDLPPQESKFVQLRSKRSYSATQNTKSCKLNEQRPSLQSHRLSAPTIAVFSDTEYTLETSSKADSLLYAASKSLQDLNMSVEPPSPTEDDLHGIERLSKQESKNFLQVKPKPRFQQRIAQTKKFANCDPKNLQNFAARTQSSRSSKDSTTRSPSSLLHTAHSSVGAEASIHSKSSSVAQCSEGKAEEAGYQPETNLFLQDNKDSMHFSSSDINPYIHPWQQDGSCKIGWKQYIFGSASDVSCNQIPLNLENRKVMRCSSVDNGLNSQNSPFHSHLSSYATAKVLSSTLSSIEGLQGWENVRQNLQSAYSSDSTKQYSNVSSETLETTPENNTAELENPSAQPGNSSVQVDEIVLLYPSESERASKKLPGATCEQGTQTATPGRYKRQRRHQRSYTDVSARKQETNRDLVHHPSSWTSMQNLSMHLSQLLQNTSELLGNLSQQSIIDNEQNAKMNQRGTEEAVKAPRSDSCTQTTADVGTQTEILEEPQSKHEEKQMEEKVENELRVPRAVNVDWNEIGTDAKILKRKEETLSLEERTQERAGVRSLGNPDFHDSLDSILEDSFMRLPLLPRTSTPIVDCKKPSLNAQQNVAFTSTRVSSVISSSLSSGQDGSSCTVVSSPTDSTSQSAASYPQDKRSVNELEIPAERKFYYKNTLLVDRASSPILTLSASPSSQAASSKSVCPIKQPLGYSSDASSPLHNQRKQRAGPKLGMPPHVDNFSQTETDSEPGASREHKGIRKKLGSFPNKKAAEELLGQHGSEDLGQQHRVTVDSHTTICAKRLYHSSSTLEVSDHRELLTGDLRDHGPLARSLRSVYVMRGGEGSSAVTRHEKYVGHPDTALIHDCSPPNAEFLFNKRISATCSSKTNAGTSSEPLGEASSLQFHDFFWKHERSSPAPLSDVSDVQTSFQDDNMDSVTESECDTEIPLNKNPPFAKPHRPRSYSLRDLPIHNKFSNWCGVKGSPPSLLSLSGSVADLGSQAEKKPRSTQMAEMEGKSQLCDSRSREIERLQQERAQIMSGIHLDLHQHPLTVELTEAKLNYGIGETDALLRVLQSGTGEDLVVIPVKQQLYERHMRTIETLRKEREKRLQIYQRSRSLSPQKHLSLLQTLDASQRDLDLPSRRREYLQQLRRDVVENTRVQEPKRRSIQHPSDIELLLRDYQRAREETKSEIARARDKLRERAEQEKRRIRERMFSQLQKEEARLKALASTSTLCTDSSLSLSSGPTSGYNSSNTATYTASNLSSQEGQVSSGNAFLSRDTRGRSAVRNSQLYVLEQLQKDSTFEASSIQPPLPSSSISCRFTHGLTISVSSSSTKGYQDLSKHILANATTEVMAACSHNLRNLYTCQAAAGWKYQCTEKEVLVYYKVFPSATRHGFLGAGVIERPLPYVWGLVRDPGKRHLYDRTINTARIHKKVTSHIQLVYLVTDTSLCYLKQPRDFCCITVEAKEENLSVLAVQSVYDASMPHPCKEVVRGEILPSAWVLEPDVVNGRDITRVIYMAQVDLGAPAIPARLLSSIAKRQPLVIAHLAHFLAS